MTRHRLVVRMALSGMVMLTMACAQRVGEPQPARDAAAGAPATMKPLGLVKPITVTIAGSACGHHVAPLSENLNRTNRDALGWRIRNNCLSAQKVLICAFPSNPFQPCVSNPTAGLDIGTVFTVEGGQREDLDCEAKDLGIYTKVVLVGNEVPASGCAGVPVPLQKEVLLTHRLGVHIIQ